MSRIIDCLHLMDGQCISFPAKQTIKANFSVNLISTILDGENYFLVWKEPRCLL